MNDERLQAYNQSVRLPDRSVPTPPLPWRLLVRAIVAGGCCALIVLALGRLTEWAVLGMDDRSAQARTQAEVIASFEAMSSALRLMALGMADSETVVAAAEGDLMAASRLFAAAETAITQGNAADFAVTAYGSNGQPLAWDGRPSDLSGDRLQGEEACHPGNHYRRSAGWHDRSGAVAWPCDNSSARCEHRRFSVRWSYCADFDRAWTRSRPDDARPISF